MKNPIFALLTFVVLLSPSLVNAQYTITIDDVEFEAETGTITRYKWPAGAGSSIIIPDNFNGIAVTNLAIASFLNYAFTIDKSPGLTDITIPGSVKTIGHSTFMYNSISTVTFAEGLETIDEEAFSGNKITSLILPNSVQSMGINAFGGNEITDIVFPQNLKIIGKGTFRSNKIAHLNLPPALERIEEDAFAQNNISHIELPVSVTYLSGFRGNKFTALIVPGHVKEIGIHAFIENSTTSLIIENGVEKIGYGAFYNFETVSKVDIKELYIPSSVKYIDTWAFRSNYNLSSVTFSEGLEYIGDAAFMLCNLRDVVIPTTVKTISDGAFTANNMETLVLNEGLEKIGHSAFSENKFTSVTIPGTVKRIGSKAFYGNTTMTNIELKPGVEVIGSECFSYNQSVNSISLPSSLLQIEENAFFNTFFVEFPLPIISNIDNKEFSHWARYRGATTNVIDRTETLKSNDTNGYIVVFKDVSTGIDDETKEKLAYTNTVNETFRINHAGKLEIYSLTGVKEVEKTIESNQPVDVSHLEKGIYIFELNGNVKGKIVKR